MTPGKFSNTPRLVSAPPPKITTWGQALRQCRERAGFALHEIARHSSVSQSEVEKWEEGLGFPKSYQLKGIYTLKGMRVLTTFQNLLPERSREASAEAKPAVEVIGAAVKVTPPAEPEGPIIEISPEPVEKKHRNFAVALRAIRETEKLSQRDLGALIGVHGSVISGYETGNTLPIKSIYDALVTLLPALKDAPKPRGIVDRAKWGTHTAAKLGVREEKKMAAPAAPPLTLPPAPAASPIESAALAYARALKLAHEKRAEMLSLRERLASLQAEVEMLERNAAKALSEVHEAVK